MSQELSYFVEPFIGWLLKEQLFDIIVNIKMINSLFYNYINNTNFGNIHCNTLQDYYKIQTLKAAFSIDYVICNNFSEYQEFQKFNPKKFGLNDFFLEENYQNIICIDFDLSEDFKFEELYNYTDLECLILTQKNDGFSYSLYDSDDEDDFIPLDLDLLNFPKLTYLELFNISYIYDLETLINLETLILKNVQCEIDCSKFPKLISLTCGSYYIRNERPCKIKNLDSLKQLKSLTLWHNVQYDNLPKLDSLIDLHLIEFNHKIDLSSFNNITSLELHEIYLSMNLSDLTNLTELSIYNCSRITDISYLSKLEYLYIDINSKINFSLLNENVKIIYH